MPRLRFPRSARLTRVGEFGRVRTEGRSEHGRLMVCGSLQTGDGSSARVGFITSRRVGSAVVRSRVRRKLREVVRLDRPKLAAGCWIVLVARAGAAEATFEALQAEWRRLAKRAGVLILEA